MKKAGLDTTLTALFGKGLDYASGGPSLTPTQVQLTVLPMYLQDTRRLVLGNMGGLQAWKL